MGKASPIRKPIKYVDFVPDSEEEDIDPPAKCPPVSRPIKSGAHAHRQVLGEPSDNSSDSDISLASLKAAPPSQNYHFTDKLPRPKNSSQETLALEISPSSSKEVSQMLVVDDHPSSQTFISAGDASQQSQLTPLSKTSRPRSLIKSSPSTTSAPPKEGTPSQITTSLITSRSPRKKHEIPDTRTTEVSKKPDLRIQRQSDRGDGAQTPTKKPNPRKSKVDPVKAHLEEYCKQFFQEISRTVFNNLFGEETKLEWSNRLTRTAGKAHYSQHADGSEDSRIELSYKVVDREDRVRNTLSHEMCHLAAWRFNGNRDGGHGHEWTSWATKVMQRYPSIMITQTHTYDIDYPFKWKCLSCGLVYADLDGGQTPSQFPVKVPTANVSAYPKVNGLIVCVCNGDLEMIASKPGRVLTGRLESGTRSPNPSPRPRRRPDVSVIDLTCDVDHEVEELADEVHALNLSCSA